MLMNRHLQVVRSHAQAAESLTGLRSRVGGMARLQKAIVLDSVGRSGEAKELYTALKSHPHGDLAKRARRLLFGFQVPSCGSFAPERCLGNALPRRAVALVGCAAALMTCSCHWMVLRYFIESGRMLVRQAMDNLKAHTMSYAPSKGAYESYFRRIESRYSNVYFAPATEDRTVLPELFATSVMVAPLLAAAYVVLRK